MSSPRVSLSHHTGLGTTPARGPVVANPRYREGQRGFTMVWFALTLVVLLSFAGFAVDIANLWFTAQRVQRAADAAALGAAAYMPSDLPGATTEGRSLAAVNGYAQNVTGYLTNATVTVTQESNPYRARVRITYTVPTYFATLMGVDSVTITREAVGEYQGPVPMGSPTNSLGNQPTGAGNTAWLASNPADIANTAPQVWANIAGPNTDKGNGDRYAAQYCSDTANYHNCTSNVNGDYTPNGYFFTVRVKVTTSDLTKRLALQAYDPAFVQQGDTCDDFGGPTVPPAEEQAIRNQLVALNVDRYRDPAPYDGSTFNATYCPGDTFIRDGFGLPTTSFTVRKPDATPWNNLDNPVVTASGCPVRTYAPVAGTSSTASNRLAVQLNPATTGSAASYVRSVYHRWATLCHVSLASVGIRTAGTHDVMMQVQTSGGAGHNRFAIRSGLTTGSSLTSVVGTKTSIFAAGRLPLFANASGADSQFHIARLLPGNAGRTLSLQLFDVGDAADVGTIQVLPPADAKKNGVVLTVFSGCTFSRHPAGGTTLTTTASTCTVSSVHSGNGYNGRTVIINVPVPIGYTCDEASAFGCWVKMRFTYGAGVSVTDTTTWTAAILGDPVRLIE